MRTMTLSPDELCQIADKIEDDAYRSPETTRRQAILALVYSLRSKANIAKWSGEISITIAVIDKNVVGRQEVSFQVQRSKRH